MPPAVRIGDLHTCSGGGGAVSGGSPSVLIGGQPAARAGDSACPGEIIVNGSPTVFIGGKPAARVGDTSTGAGVLAMGLPTVNIGDSMTVAPGALAGGLTPEEIAAGLTPAQPRPGSDPSKPLPEKGHKAPKPGESGNEAAKAGEEGAATSEEEDEELLKILNAPATIEMLSAFLKVADGFFQQLGGAVSPAMREVLSAAVTGAQQAAGTLQIAAINEALRAVGGGFQEIATVVPPEQIAQATGGAPPGGQAAAGTKDAGPKKAGLEKAGTAPGGATPGPPAEGSAGAPAAPAQDTVSKPAAPPPPSQFYNPLAYMRLRPKDMSHAHESHEMGAFGMVRAHGRKAHQGWDLAANLGTPVHAMADGVIEDVCCEDVSDYGLSITLAFTAMWGTTPVTHYAFYAHLSEVWVKPGMPVRAGMPIGRTGDSGNARGEPPHLHFEVRTSKVAGRGLANRLDPGLFLGYRVYTNLARS
jgi:murein DD-endopeptidase MepM/ murein hydrolase activator NlpD/uncharacterized Zn-binding protein involved in type VI secretion